MTSNKCIYHPMFEGYLNGDKCIYNKGCEGYLSYLCLHVVDNTQLTTKYMSVGSIITDTTTCFDLVTINQTQTEICVYFYAKKEGV